MIKTLDIYKLQDDVKELFISGPGITPNIHEVIVADWVLNPDTSIHEYVLVHGNGIPMEYITIKFYKDKDSSLMSYSYIDDNSIKIYSDEAVAVSVVLHEKNAQATKVDLTDYYNKTEIDTALINKSNVDHTHAKEECDDPFIKDWGDLPKTPMENAPITELILPKDWDSPYYAILYVSNYYLLITERRDNNTIRGLRHATLDFRNVTQRGGYGLTSDFDSIIESNDPRIELDYIRYPNVIYKYTRLPNSITPIKANVSLVKGDTLSLSEYKGISGEIIANMESKQIHLMDGETLGGHKMATSKRVEEVFQYVSKGKSTLETAIADKGGTVSKANNTATFDELSGGIATIQGEDLAGKQKILDVLLTKKPELVGILDIDSPLHVYATHMMEVGPISIVLNDSISDDVIIQTMQNYIGTVDAYIIDSTMVLSEPLHELSIATDNIHYRHTKRIMHINININ